MAGESTHRAFVEITLDDRGVVTGIDVIDKSLAKVGTTAKTSSAGMEQFESAVKKGSTAGAFFGTVMANVAQNVLVGVKDATLGSINAAAAFSAQMTGLTTVAKAFGQDVDAAKAAAVALAKDGLMTTGEAAAGLKNLLSAGFGLPEAIQLMKGFKDSAAFNRQGTLEFGQAIVGATEGIKNQNSIMVDNAGLTKNLSVIMKEAGLKVEDLGRVSSDAGVRAKFLGGIMRELGTFTGDSAKLANEYSGQLSALKTSVTNLAIETGRGLLPAASATVGALNSLVGVVRENREGFSTFVQSVAAIAAPMVLFKTLTLANVPSLLALGTTAKALGATFEGLSVRSIPQARLSLEYLGNQAGFTVAKMGLLTSAASIAAAAFVGWQIGRLIADMLGLDDAIAGLVNRFDDVNKRLRAATEVGKGAAETAKELAELERRHAEALKVGSAAEAAHIERKIAAIKTDQTRLAMQDQIDKAIRQGAAATITYTEAVEFNNAKVKDATAFLALKGQTAEKTAAALKALTEEAKKSASQAMTPLAKEVRQLALDFEKGGLNAKEIAAAISKQVPAFKTTEEAVKAYLDAHKKATEEVKKHSQEIQKLRDTINGVPLKEKAREWAEALKMPGAAAKVLADEKLRKDLQEALADVEKKFGSLTAAGVGGLGELYKALQATTAVAETIPPAITPTISLMTELAMVSMEVGDANARTTATLLDMVAKGKVFKTQFDPKKFFEDAADAADKAAKSIKSVGETIREDLGPTILQAITGGGDIGRAVGGLLGKSIGENLAQSLGKTMGDLFGKTIGGVLSSVMPGIGTLLGSLAGGLFDKLSSLFSSKGRDAVVAYGDQFGGLNALHEKMLRELGQESETLWITLTQKVQRGNEAQAKSAIDAIEAAFEAHKTKAAELEAQTRAAEEAAKAAADASIQSAMDKVNGLTAEYNQLWESIKDEAPEEVMGVVEANTRARMQAVAAERAHAVNQLEELTKSLSRGFDEILGKLDQFIDRLAHIPPVRITATVDAPQFEAPEGDYEAPEYHQGGYVRRFHDGGPAFRSFQSMPIRFATGGEVPAILERGEYVVRRKAVAKIGLPAMEAINEGRSPFDMGALKLGLDEVVAGIAGLRRDAVEREPMARESMRRALRDAIQTIP